MRNSIRPFTPQNQPKLYTYLEMIDEEGVYAIYHAEKSNIGDDARLVVMSGTSDKNLILFVSNRATGQALTGLWENHIFYKTGEVMSIEILTRVERLNRNEEIRNAGRALQESVGRIMSLLP